MLIRLDCDPIVFTDANQEGRISWETVKFYAGFPEIFQWEESQLEREGGDGSSGAPDLNSKHLFDDSCQLSRPPLILKCF